MGKSSVVKVIIIVAALSAAGAILVVSNRTPKATVVKDAKPIDFVCLKCGHEFQLSYADFVKARQAPRPAATDSSSEGKRVRKLAMVVEVDCPGCNERSAVPADRCPKHACLHPKMLPDGSRGFCPKCPRPGGGG